MSRVALVAALGAAAILGGCASKAQQHPPTTLPNASLTVKDPRGDAFDASGSARRGRPDIDIRTVQVTRNDSTAVRFTFNALAKPTAPVRYQVFAQAAEVAGYDFVQVTRNGPKLSGYVAFENSVAKQALPPTAFTAKGTSFSIDVPFDPILGSSTFQWRATLSTGSGPQISDYVPSAAGLKRFP